MSNIWNYREGVVRDKSTFIDYDVEATDGGIGKITEESIAVDASHVVVDTGVWILGKKRILPAGVITGIDHDSETVYVALTKAEVKDAPDYVDESSIDTHPSYRDAIETYFIPWV